MEYSDELEFTIGDTDLRITKDGRIQIRAKKGTAMYSGEGGNATTTSTTFVDVDRISPNNLPRQIATKRNQIKLKKIVSVFKKNKSFLKKLASKSPLELEWVDINLGIIRARFRRKRKRSK